MGLDMYAYTINQEMVEGQGETDVDLHTISRQATGFKYLSDPELEKLTHEEKDDYFRRMRDAGDRAREIGMFDSDFAYWRKFNNLHCWMEKLYRSKGGNSPSFNCNTVRLRIGDLDRLDREAANLEACDGFFWGAAEEMSAEDIVVIFKFTTKARAAIAEGKAVFYDSWW
jgi:hypothetical protein